MNYDEIDLILEAPDGRIVAIEVKAGSTPDLSDARQLIWLRDKIGDQFVRGVVFHTGTRPFKLAEKYTLSQSPRSGAHHAREAQIRSSPHIPLSAPRPSHPRSSRRVRSAEELDRRHGNHGGLLTQWHHRLRPLGRTSS